MLPEAVQGGARGAVDDVIVAVAGTHQAPLLVVAAVPGRLPGGRAVRGVAPAVDDHAVGVVDDPVIAVAEVHELPLQVGAAVVVPLLEVRPGRDVPAAVDHETGGGVGDLHPAGGDAAPVQCGDGREKVSFTTYASALNGALLDGICRCRPLPSWAGLGRLTYDPAALLISCAIRQVADAELAGVQSLDRHGAALPAERGAVQHRVVLAAGKPDVLRRAGHVTGEGTAAHRGSAPHRRPARLGWRKSPRRSGRASHRSRAGSTAAATEWCRPRSERC